MNTRRRAVPRTSRGATATVVAQRNGTQSRTTGRCPHYQNNEFSLPVAVLTTRAMNSDYRLLFSLPEQWVVTTRAMNSHYRSLLSLPEQYRSLLSLPIPSVSARSERKGGAGPARGVRRCCGCGVCPAPLLHLPLHPEMAGLRK